MKINGKTTTVSVEAASYGPNGCTIGNGGTDEVKGTIQFDSPLSTVMVQTDNEGVPVKYEERVTTCQSSQYAKIMNCNHPASSDGNYTYRFNKESHWRYCPYCDMSNYGNEEHRIENGYCTVCSSASDPVIVTFTANDKEMNLWVNAKSNIRLPGCINGATPPEGKIFGGWDVPTAGDTTQTKQPGDTIEVGLENMIIEAHWADKCTASFAANGGTGEMEPVDVAKDSVYTLPNCNFTPPNGKTFDGWIVDDSDTSKDAGDKIAVSEDVTLKAKWTELKATVHFDHGEGEGAMEDAEVLVHTVLELPECTFKAPTDKGFKCWRDEDNMVYLPGDRLLYDFPREYTMTAIYDDNEWNALSYTLLNAPSGYVLDVKKFDFNNDGTIESSSGDPLKVQSSYVTLDLNGVTLRKTDNTMLLLDGNYVLTIKDSSEDEKGVITTPGNTCVAVKNGAELVLESGSITGGYQGVALSQGGAMTMTGGAIKDNTGNTSACGVRVGEDCTFAMRGGEISFNKNNPSDTGSSANNGAGVYVDKNGSFVMNGGAIQNNTSAFGSGVYLFQGASFIMRDGIIYGNKAQRSSDDSALGCSGAVYLDGGSSFTMTGGNIIHNSANKGGSGVYVCGQSIFNLEGGYIQSNSASAGVEVVGHGTYNMSGGTISGNDGGVYLSCDEDNNYNGTNGLFNLTVGRIIDNMSTDYGGVYVKTGVFKLSGEPEIKGNMKGTGSDATPSNVFLSDDKVIRINGKLKSKACIGVTRPNGGVFTTGLPENGAPAAFISDDEQYGVFESAEKEAMLALAVKITFDANDGSGKMEKQTMECNTATELTLNAFTRAGYSFKGWNTAKDGSGTAYADGETVTLAANMTLYAQWTIAPSTPGKPAQSAPTDLAAVDATSAEAADGMITGATDQMEYSANGGESWTKVPEGATEITGLAPGEYLVRMAETPDYKVSEAVKLTVGDKSAGASPTYDALSEEDKKEADAIAVAHNTDKETAAQMLKYAKEHGIPLDTVKLSDAAIKALPTSDEDPAGSTLNQGVLQGEALSTVRVSNAGCFPPKQTPPFSRGSLSILSVIWLR